jgi:hypothetical protein
VWTRLDRVRDEWALCDDIELLAELLEVLLKFLDRDVLFLDRGVLFLSHGVLFFGCLVQFLDRSMLFLDRVLLLSDSVLQALHFAICAFQQRVHFVEHTICAIRSVSSLVARFPSSLIRSRCRGP